MDLGYFQLKFFPAEANGGAKALSAISAPLPQISFCPTGGINLSNVNNYLALLLRENSRRNLDDT